MRWLIGLAGLLAIGAAPVPRTIAPAKFVEWKAEGGTRSFRSGDVTVRVSLSGKDSDSAPVFTISAPGTPVLRISNDDTIAHYGTSIAIGPLVRGAPSSVIVQAWTGGAHCCMHIVVALRGDRGFKPIDLGIWDGDGAVWPKDASGDGVADFQFVDNALLYKFDCYACSWAPPQIMTIRAGKATDISTEPVFRRLFVADMAKARKACFAQDTVSAHGACAGYLADAARLGQFAQAKGEVSRRFAKDDPDFVSSVAAFLRERNYLR
ncbi:hypothetical protein FPZ24_16765 [Sphingomonas panacisoli]|uniref:Uncharacterized protein n=1 Tax=Sphingomonas panacisoli TaxID=1813879 RepID=A0A5B8LP77_9SPHN|nr:hypothetical protein [Sphingomonas panacisoli]QDZ08920.1 hypothetical protein FPZ24_16765 [Sphingomonas panacisoli]